MKTGTCKIGIEEPFKAQIELVVREPETTDEIVAMYGANLRAFTKRAANIFVQENIRPVFEAKVVADPSMVTDAAFLAELQLLADQLDYTAKIDRSTVKTKTVVVDTTGFNKATVKAMREAMALQGVILLEAKPAV